MYLQSHSLVGSWTLHSNFISMWNSTRNTGESLPRELKLKCTRDTPGFHIKQKPSIILRDHEMHLTHLHLQQWTQISHKMSEAFRGMGRSWHIIVLACGPKCIISIRKCREKGRERECWRMGTSKYLVSRKNFPRISTTQYTQLIPEDIQRVNSSIPVHLLLGRAGLRRQLASSVSRNFRPVPKSRVPAGPRTWRPVTPVTWVVWPGGPVRAAPWFRWRGKVSRVWWGGVAWFVRYASRHVARRHPRRLPALFSMLATSSPRRQVYDSILLPWSGEVLLRGGLQAAAALDPHRPKLNEGLRLACPSREVRSGESHPMLLWSFHLNASEPYT